LRNCIIYVILTKNEKNVVFKREKKLGMKTLSNDLDREDLKNKLIMYRADCNVPMGTNGEILDSTRLDAILPTIDYLIQNKCRVLLFSHLGKPDGKNMKFSLRPVMLKLKSMIKCPFFFVDDCLAEIDVDKVPLGSITMFENLRFYKGEEMNDDDFSRKLAHGVDIYVNDAFGAIHRDHASMTGVTTYIEKCYAGFLLEREMKMFELLIDNTQKPFGAIIGGSKISTKIKMIRELMNKVDILMISGAMVFTFLDAFGMSVGDSRVEENQKETVLAIEKLAKEKNVELLFPLDFMVSTSVENTDHWKIVPSPHIGNGWIGVDHGPITNRVLREKFIDCKCIFWNGPMGVYENPTFSTGTNFVANFIAERGSHGVTTIVGGGDSVGVIRKYKLDHKISHISTGGGSFLQLFSDRKTRAIRMLE